MNSRKYKFGSPLSENPTIFGAKRPGYTGNEVQEWINFMQEHEIGRVLCLLSDSEVDCYDNLLGLYQSAFGFTHVLLSPIEDYHLATEDQLLTTIIPFLQSGHEQGIKTVIHCAGGIGRTGHVLAAWLVSNHGFTNESAIAAVGAEGRNAQESGDVNLEFLLDACRHKFAP